MPDWFDEIEVHRGRLHHIRDTLLELAEGSRDPIGPTEASLLAGWCDQIVDTLRGL